MTIVLPRYPIIYADPPWAYRGREQFSFAGDVGVSTGGAVKQYPTMSLPELCRLPVHQITADDALLFLWVTSPLLVDGIAVMRAWGFDYATVAFVWDKRATNPGYYTLSQVELCLVGKHGRIPRPRGSRSERQLLSELRTTHSAKPAEVRARIERMFPSVPRIELFARVRAPRWDVWGRDINTNNQIERAASYA